MSKPTVQAVGDLLWAAGVVFAVAQLTGGRKAGLAEITFVMAFLTLIQVKRVAAAGKARP